MGRLRVAPCPFCGYRDIGVNRGTGWAWCECDRCGATGPFGDTVEWAVERWGRSASDDKEGERWTARSR